MLILTTKWRFFFKIQQPSLRRCNYGKIIKPYIFSIIFVFKHTLVYIVISVLSLEGCNLSSRSELNQHTSLHWITVGIISSRWRHNGHDGVSNHQPHYCLLHCLLRHTSKKTSKLRVTGLCAGNSSGTGEFPAQMASNAENVSISWHHHVVVKPCALGPRFNLNMAFPCMGFHFKHSMVVRPSYLYDQNSYTGKTTSIYWNRPLVLTRWKPLFSSNTRIVSSFRPTILSQLTQPGILNIAKIKDFF